MATFNLINDWLENMVEVANCGTDQFALALSNTAPGSEGTAPTGNGAGILANVTQIAYTNLPTSLNLTTGTSAQTGGTYTLVINDWVGTATGGSVAAFRYVYVYDDTPSSPANPLVCYYDYGSSITLAENETFTVDFDETNGLFKIT